MILRGEKIRLFQIDMSNLKHRNNAKLTQPQIIGLTQCAVLTQEK